MEMSICLPPSRSAESSSASSTWVNASSPAFKSVSGGPHWSGGPSGKPVKSIYPHSACIIGS